MRDILVLNHFVFQNCSFVGRRLPNCYIKIMSIDSLKVELGSRSGRDALPDFFPIDVIISLTRELALVVDRAQSSEDLGELHGLILEYLRKVLKMQGQARLDYFEANLESLLPGLVEELYEYTCAELVSRMIGYDVQKGVLHDRFSRFLTESSSDGAPSERVQQEGTVLARAV